MTGTSKVTLCLWLVGSVAACRATGDHEEDRKAARPESVLTYTSPMWYEETGRYFQVAPDGRTALYGSGARARLYDIATGQFTSLSNPPAAQPRLAPDGSRVANFTPGEPTITLNASSGAPVTIRLDGNVDGLTWTTDGHALYAIVLHPTGLSSLVRASVDGAVTIVRPELDASPFFNSLAFSNDGRTLFLALAGQTVPDPKIRHDPEAPHRDLDIYALDLKTGQLRDVAPMPGDDCCPFVAGGFLYWTHNDPGADVVVFPRSGGEPRAVADHGFLPRWSPDARQIAFTRGYFRLSDYGLDMDGWVVGVDGAGAVTSPARSWIAGFGEDMGPVWSPDGRWVAYHSHRSAAPVPLYESPGRTDDIWLEPAAGGNEIRLTDFGYEVGPPDWAPDGRRLIFDSWDRNGVPRFAKPWILAIDPATGRSRGAARMPLPAQVAGIGGEAWSPLGGEIAFIERIDDVRRALWLSHPDGTGAHRLTEFRSYTLGGVSWTPDGQHLLYSALVDDRMQILDIARVGGAPRQLTHGDANMMHPSVSPKGDWVAASRIPWRKELWRVKLP